MCELVRIDLINCDSELQMRTTTDEATISEYAEAMADGAVFPPIIVFHDGETFWPGDGFHRIAAAKRAGKAEILADIRQGAKRDAMLHATGANANHGLRRSAEDKRRAVTAILRDPEWNRWSDRQIGKQCAVDHKTVAKVRSELTGEFPTERTYKTRHGTVATMKVAVPEQQVGNKTMVNRLLATVKTHVLIAECERRGLEVINNAN